MDPVFDATSPHPRDCAVHLDGERLRPLGERLPVACTETSPALSEFHK